MNIVHIPHNKLSSEEQMCLRDAMKETLVDMENGSIGQMEIAEIIDIYYVRNCELYEEDLEPIGDGPESQESIIAWCDGGSSGNPGPAYGSFVIEVNGKEVVRVARSQYGEGTNNEAEYKSLINCIHALNKLGYSDAEIRTDSQLLVGQLMNGWKCKADNLKPLRQMAFDTLAEGHKIVKTPRNEIEKKLGH